MKYLLIGKNRYVGRKFSLLPYFQNNLISIGRDSFNYYDKNVLSDFLKNTKPTFLINAAGYTGKPNVDACELAKSECLLGNVVLPGIIREVCEDLKIPWGHVSSGYIYAGRRSDGNGYTEEDAPNFSFRSSPCSFYSGTKALGEEVLEGAKELLHMETTHSF
jgi:UDP-glucose 4,6-dehydratase